MQVLDYFLPQPEFDLTTEKQAAFVSLFDSSRETLIDYQLPYPKWQFLSYLCSSRDLVLHGSQNMSIEMVEPQKATDIKAISNQKAIYATTDGIWSIFFAIVDRKNFKPLSLFNSCLNIRISPDNILGPLYFFSITHSALIQQPWCDGMVYLLPREEFIQEAAQQVSGAEIVFPHWYSYKPTAPITRLPVQPSDFPFMRQIHGHDDATLVSLAAKDPGGFPWAEAVVT
jgi:hypothetical protein